MHTLSVKIYNLAGTESADITPICYVKRASRRRNLSRAFTVQVPSNHTLVSDLFGDGFQAGEAGDRKLVVTRDGTTIHHGRIFTDERVGDGLRNRTTFTSFDPIMELGYEADDRAGRPVRDETGNFIDPTFLGTGSGGTDVISGPDLLQQALTNSINSDPTVGEGPLPITLGDFDVDIGPAIDLSVIDKMDWPILLGDFLVELLATDVFDVDCRPIAISEDLGYAMGEISAKNRIGSDKSGTVHFDYWTGLKNAARARYIADFSTVCNKLFDYLGPRLDKRHWRGNITPTAPNPGDTWPSEFTDAIAASRARYGGPDGGQFMQIRDFSSLENENSNRPLWVARYKAEASLRVLPRKLLYITPSIDSKGLFEPYTDYDAGDEIALNVAQFGLNIAATQIVHGFDVEWDRNGVERVSELLTTAEEAA